MFLSLNTNLVAEMICSTAGITFGEEIEEYIHNFLLSLKIVAHKRYDQLYLSFFF